MCQARVFRKWVRWKLWQISIKSLFLNIRVGIRVRGLHLVFQNPKQPFNRSVPWQEVDGRSALANCEGLRQSTALASSWGPATSWGQNETARTNQWFLSPTKKNKKLENHKKIVCIPVMNSHKLSYRSNISHKNGNSSKQNVQNVSCGGRGDLRNGGQGLHLFQREAARKDELQTSVEAKRWEEGFGWPSHLSARLCFPWCYMKFNELARGRKSRNLAYSSTGSAVFVGCLVFDRGCLKMPGKNRPLPKEIIRPLLEKDGIQKVLYFERSPPWQHPITYLSQILNYPLLLVPSPGWGPADVQSDILLWHSFWHSFLTFFPNSVS